jgi:hypothetical protein
MKVTVIDYKDLPEEEKDNQPDNGSGKEYASYLKVEIPGKSPVYYSDAMEPEDTRFYRDLSWVKDALLAAYQAGKESGLTPRAADVCHESVLGNHIWQTLNSGEVCTACGKRR